MIELSSSQAEVATVAPPLVPDSSIDADHLSRMTLGDRGLEREVLHLFDLQSSMLIDRMRRGPAAAIATSAHTLKGSARGIGAWRIASAAERVEATASGWDSNVAAAVDDLARTVAEAHEAIGRMLQTN